MADLDKLHSSVEELVESIKKIPDRLLVVETKADSYITGKEFGLWAVGTGVAIIGVLWVVSSSQKSDLQAEFDAAITRAEKNIAAATEKALKLERGAIVGLISEELGQVADAKFGALPSVAAAGWGQLIPLDGKGALVRANSSENGNVTLEYVDEMTASSTAQKLADIVQESLRDGATSAPVAIESLYVRNADGSFSLAFPSASTGNRNKP